jgi:DNA repair protein SbcD/Mre11
VISLKGLPEEGYKAYADRLHDINRYYADHMLENPLANSVDVLMGHFMIHGAIPSGTERELHIGEAYMASADAIPTTIKYAALGHIHQAQDAPGSAVPARFAGSVMQLDFGEAGQEKSVVIVDAEPGMRKAQVTTIPVTAGRTLLKLKGTMDELRTRVDEVGSAWLHVSVQTDGPRPGLADEVREFLPNALQVYADYERRGAEVVTREGRTLPQLYGDYYEQRHGAAPAPPLVEAFEDLAAQVGAEL